jgi:hypothetical protein
MKVLTVTHRSSGNISEYSGHGLLAFLQMQAGGSKLFCL